MAEGPLSRWSRHWAAFTFFSFDSTEDSFFGGIFKHVPECESQTTCWGDTPLCPAVWRCSCFTRKPRGSLRRCRASQARCARGGGAFLEERFPPDNTFDICSALPSSSGVNRKTSFTFFFSPWQEFITFVDIYPAWTEISADSCDTLHTVPPNDWRVPERNASFVSTHSPLANPGMHLGEPLNSSVGELQNVTHSRAELSSGARVL